jgi:hypothetical protein
MTRVRRWLFGIVGESVEVDRSKGLNTRARVRFALIFGLLGVTAGFAAGCRHDISPSFASLAGTWTGTGLFPTGTTVTFQLVQVGAAGSGEASGTWVTNTSEHEPSGVVVGSVNGANGVALDFRLDPGVGCPFPVRVRSQLDGNSMTGTYATEDSTCSLTVAGNGTWTSQ